MISVALGNRTPTFENPSQIEAKDNLELFGIKVGQDGVLIAINHSKIPQLLRGTQWTVNWHETMRRMYGVTVTDNYRRIGARRTKFVVVPTTYFLDERAH